MRSARKPRLRCRAFRASQALSGQKTGRVRHCLSAPAIPNCAPWCLPWLLRPVVRRLIQRQPASAAPAGHGSKTKREQVLRVIVVGIQGIPRKAV